MKKFSFNALFTFAASLFSVMAFAQNPQVKLPLSAPVPNLIISSIVTEKAVYAPGETVNCKVTIKNVGSAKAIGTLDDPIKGYMVDLVLSTDAIAPIAYAVVPNPYEYQEDMLVIGGRHSNTKTLAPGQEDTYLESFPLPKVMAKPCQIGYVAVGAIADPGKKVTETNENDNTNFTRFKLNCSGPTTAPRPDLVITYMALADPIGGPGLPFSDFKVEVKNIGTAPAAGTDTDPNGYMVDIITSSNTAAPMAYAPLAAVGQFPEDKLVIGGRISNTKTLLPGASHIYYLNAGEMKLPMVDLHNYCGRSFFLGGIVDPGLKIAEVLETNNQRFIEFRVDCKAYTGAK